MVGNTTDYLLGATAVVALFLQSHILMLAAHVDSLQEQLRKEIDRVVGRERLPTWADHVHMPLTMATIWEMYRWKACTPFGIPRGKTQSSTSVAGKRICPGESLATAEVFIYLTMLLQKFRILPEEGTTVQIGSYQPLYEHAATKIRFLPRSD
ncbi:hypothetical protein MTO96_025954 [Rhipicephalus appendiculatus]